MTSYIETREAKPDYIKLTEVSQFDPNVHSFRLFL